MEFGNIADNFIGLCFVKIKAMKITEDGFEDGLTAHFYDKDYYNPQNDKTDSDLPPF